LISTLEKWDILIAKYIHVKIKNPKLDFLLSKVNRGEVFIIITLIILSYSNIDAILLSILYISILAFINDRIVLIIKKRISRKRPSLKILGKENNHPDLNHSFPSAHAANSMIAVILLVFNFNISPFFLLISVFAGVGRMLSLHHFLSDVIGGWIIGFCLGILGVFFYPYFQSIFNSF
jgi:membrane-associated phospholipid phosphatase